MLTAKSRLNDLESAYVGKKLARVGLVGIGPTDWRCCAIRAICTIRPVGAVSALEKSECKSSFQVQVQRYRDMD